jgi:hypothetical protein
MTIEAFPIRVNKRTVAAPARRPPPWGGAMSTLSPAAQAVLDAFWKQPGDRSALAAALRAAADQVVSASAEPSPCINVEPERDVAFIGAWHIWNTQNRIRRDLLALAAELEQAGEGCADCLRRTSPGGSVHMEPPPIIAFECEYSIAPGEC